MLTLVSVISGMVFVLLAGLNPWIMLTNRANSKPSGRTWMRVHRTVGYVFIAVFMVTAYFMLLRLKGESDELAPRILLHMLLALTLAPLLLMKVLVARYQPQGSSVLLPALGITIFLLSFTVVAVNVVSARAARCQRPRNFHHNLAGVCSRCARFSRYIAPEKTRC